MLDSQKIAKMTEEEINEIAYKYWKAKLTNDKSEMENYKIILYLICVGTSILSRKMRAILTSWGFHKETADMEIIDYFDDMFKYFNYV